MRPKFEDELRPGTPEEVLRTDSSQYAERILNKIAKPFNETFTGLKCMLQGFRICFNQNPRLRGIESTC